MTVICTRLVIDRGSCIVLRLTFACLNLSPKFAQFVRTAESMVGGALLTVRPFCHLDLTPFVKI